MKHTQSRDEWQIALLLFLILLSCYAYFFPRWADWNQNSRLDLTLAIVEQRRFAIDDYYENTGDYAVYGNHVYTDKAPGTSFLGVPAYAIFRLLTRFPPANALLQRLSATEALEATLREGGTGLLEQKVHFAAALYFVTFCVISLPSALLGVILYSFLGRILKEGWQRALVVLAYGLATIVFPYSSVFYGHQIAAVLLFSAFALLYRVRHGEVGGNGLWGVGGLMGLAVLIEFPALFPAIGLGLYALWFLPRKSDLLKVALAGLPFALLLGFYNYSCFGSPFASSYKYLATFPVISNTGVLGFGAPDWEALWGITFSPYRGLFFLAPFLLLVVPGFYYITRNRSWRVEGLLLLGIVVAQIGLISAWYDWRGGFAIGPRNLLPIMPFLILPVAFCLQAWQDRPALETLAWGAVTLSFGLTWVASTAGQDFAPVAINNPLVDFFWPRFRAGDITRNLGMSLGLRSWWSLLPPLLLIGAVTGGLTWMFRGSGKRGLARV